MESPSESHQWATKYLIDPLTAPEPSDETGPGSHFTSSMKAPVPSGSKSKIPQISAFPSPPQSGSVTQSAFSPSNPTVPEHRHEVPRQPAQSTTNQYRADEPAKHGKASRRRASSLGERYPGDLSHRPLDQLRKESKTADRSPHLRKKHIPGADSIDVLDKSTIGVVYHHGGPYDATLNSRNTEIKNSPVDAVRGTNNKALKATPGINIRNALDKHVPLQGTAIIPPGQAGPDGRVMNYEEGADLMREKDAAGGPYKRWDHVKYLPEDYKGKGEPSFSIEKALKDQERTLHRKPASDGNSYEMQPASRPSNNRQRSASGSHPNAQRSQRATGNAMGYSQYQNDVQRSNSTGRGGGDTLKKRFGSSKTNQKNSEF